MKATVKSPANIAFVKYWGKADPVWRLPANNSISMCLSNLYTICTVEFDKKYQEDQVEFLAEKVVEKQELGRIRQVLDRARKLTGVRTKAKVVTVNNFPKAVGIASSASGLSAVTLTAITALGLKLSERRLSKLARLASGTACRSIPDGFVEWEKGTGKDDSYARQIFPPGHWDISDVVVIVTQKMKKVKSTQGHERAKTSPFYQERLKSVEEKVARVKKVIEKKDFTTFGQIIEQEALELHAICLTSKPPIIYWEPKTLEVMKKVQAWRENGLETYFTIDAGPSVHLICQGKDEKKVVRRLGGLRWVERIAVNKPGMGARVVDEHLF